MEHKRNSIVLFFLLLFLGAAQCPVSALQQGAFDQSLMTGERVVTFRTHDGVTIVGSLFLPPGLVDGPKMSLSEVHFAGSLWTELEKDLVVTTATPRKAKAWKIPVREGNFTYAESEIPEDRPADASQAPVPEADRQAPLSGNEERAPAREECSPAVQPFIPMERSPVRIDPVNELLTPYGHAEQKFFLDVPYRPPSPPEEETRKKAIEKYLEAMSQEQRPLPASAAPAPSGPEPKAGPRPAPRADLFLLPNETTSAPAASAQDSCFCRASAGGGKCYPAVILLHMWRRDRHEWEPLVPHLQNAGFVVLSFDLRGHGESITKEGKRISVDKFVTQNYRQMLDDAFSAYEFLLQQDVVDPSRISLVGASLGTVISVNLCEKVNGLKPYCPVRSVTLLSASKNFFAVQADQSIKKCAATPFLFIMDRQDPAADKNDIFLSGYALFESFRGPKKEIILDGVGHGTAMMNGDGVIREIVGFIKENSEKK